MKKRSRSFPEHIDQSWTLFLDRDGVINRRIPDNYVLRWDQFEFLPGVVDAIMKLSSVFGKIIVVTNQQGIGKGYMTEENLQDIHSNMIAEVEKQGGRIDAVYFSPHLKESNHHTRKPNVGMGLKAKKEFHSIDFAKSVMAGDSKSDMEFGHRLGMCNVLIGDDPVASVQTEELISMRFDDLQSFSEYVLKDNKR